MWNKLHKKQLPTSAKQSVRIPRFFFKHPGARKVVADFSGGFLSSDGGALLLQQVDAGLGISRTLAACFRDERDPTRVEHSIEELIRQRLFALSPGYEDLNDHSPLRHDFLLAAGIGKEEPLRIRTPS